MSHIDDIVREYCPDGVPMGPHGDIGIWYGGGTVDIPNDVVIAGAGETVGDVGKAVAWLDDSGVAINDGRFARRSAENPTYISCVTQTAMFDEQKRRYVTRAKVERLSGVAMSKIVVPVPEPDEQARIVETLNNFDALVDDISVGLPAELAARRKQYEYYRDKLLTFREAV